MKQKAKAHVVYFSIIIIFIVIINSFDIGCPILYLFDIPCPTCGVSRSLLSLVRLDIKGYFNYQPMGIPLLISVWFMLHIKLFQHTKMIYAFVVLTLVSNTFLYVYRLLYNIPII